MMLNILSTFLNGKNAKQKILIFFFHFLLAIILSITMLFISFFCALVCVLSFTFQNIFLDILCSVCVCACMCNMCTYMFEYCFFFNSDKSTKLWLNYSALSLIAQLVMDREKKSYCEMYAVNSCETI